MFKAIRAVPAIDSVESLWSAIEQTISWARPRADVAHAQRCLRAEATFPTTLPETSAFEAVRSTLAARAVQPGPARRDLAGGRLLIYFPDQDLRCGAAEAESNGFFDVYNCPPWDTWVACIEEPSQSAYILAWVPAALIMLADRGVYVNPEECIQWLDQSAVGLRTILRLSVAPT